MTSSFQQANTFCAIVAAAIPASPPAGASTAFDVHDAHPTDNNRNGLSCHMDTAVATPWTAVATPWTAMATPWTAMDSPWALKPALTRPTNSVDNLGQDINLILSELAGKTKATKNKITISSELKKRLQNLTPLTTQTSATPQPVRAFGFVVPTSPPGVRRSTSVKSSQRHLDSTAKTPPLGDVTNLSHHQRVLGSSVNGRHANQTRPPSTTSRDNAEGDMLKSVAPAKKSKEKNTKNPLSGFSTPQPVRAFQGVVPNRQAGVRRASSALSGSQDHLDSNLKSSSLARQASSSSVNSIAKVEDDKLESVVDLAEGRKKKRNTLSGSVTDFLRSLIPARSSLSLSGNSKPVLAFGGVVPTVIPNASRSSLSSSGSQPQRNSLNSDSKSTLAQQKRLSRSVSDIPKMDGLQGNSFQSKGKGDKEIAGLARELFANPPWKQSNSTLDGSSDGRLAKSLHGSLDGSKIDLAQLGSYITYINKARMRAPTSSNKVPAVWLDFAEDEPKKNPFQTEYFDWLERPYLEDLGKACKFDWNDVRRMLMVNPKLLDIFRAYLNFIREWKPLRDAGALPELAAGLLSLEDKIIVYQAEAQKEKMEHEIEEILKAGMLQQFNDLELQVTAKINSWPTSSTSL